MRSPLHAIDPALIEARRAFRIDRYDTLADVGMDGDYITPLQISSSSPTGPVLLAHHWSNAETARRERQRISPLGYLPGIPFNNVIDLALQRAGLERKDVYMTQAFHLLPRQMCFSVPIRDVDESFSRITRLELRGRRVVALGKAAAAACKRHGIAADQVVCHPSARGWTVEQRAEKLAAAIRALTILPAPSRLEQALRFQREAPNTGVSGSDLIRQFRDERATRR